MSRFLWLVALGQAFSFVTLVCVAWIMVEQGPRFSLQLRLKAFWLEPTLVAVGALVPAIPEMLFGIVTSQVLVSACASAQIVPAATQGRRQSPAESD